VTTSDGVRLFAAVLDGPAAAPFTVVLLHGFLNSSRSPRIHDFARMLALRANVVVPDLRGHGESGGASTIGLREPLDVQAAVGLAEDRWPAVPVVTVGTSLGAAAALLHAGTIGGVAGVVAVSAPAYWDADGRPGARRLASFVGGRSGRAVAAALLRTRIAAGGERVQDVDGVVAAIAPAFTIVVHDPDDQYFGPEHAQRLYDSAREPRALWWEHGLGHGSDLLTPEMATRVLTELTARLAPAPSR
jgi:pimeloyl-ACP methyl ester carboxylesterase